MFARRLNLTYERFNFNDNLLLRFSQSVRNRSLHFSQNVKASLFRSTSERLRSWASLRASIHQLKASNSGYRERARKVPSMTSEKTKQAKKWMILTFQGRETRLLCNDRQRAWPSNKEQSCSNLRNVACTSTWSTKLWEQHTENLAGILCFEVQS